MKYLRIWAVFALLVLAPSVFSADTVAQSAVQIIGGAWQQGALIKGRVEPGTQLSFLNRNVRVSVKGEFVIGLGRDAKALAVLTSSLRGIETQHEYTVKSREYRIQRVDGVPSKTVNPNKAQVARSRAEGKLVWAARQRDEARTDFLADFQWPLVGPITGCMVVSVFTTASLGGPTLVLMWRHPQELGCGRPHLGLLPWCTIICFFPVAL